MGALPLIAAAISRQPDAVAAIWVAGGLPFVLVGPFTGVLTDRWLDRRRVMRNCDIAAGCVVGACAALVALGAASIPLLIGLNFLLASVQTLRDNAALAIVPELVAPQLLDQANGRVQGAQMLTIDVLGPPAGALLVILPAGLPFFLDSASFLVAAVLVSGLAVSVLARSVASAGGDAAGPGLDEHQPSRGWGGMMRDMTDGLRWLGGQRTLRRVCVLAGLSGMAVTGALAVAVLYALEILHVGRGMYAVLVGVVASGGIAGSLLAPVLSERLGRKTTLRLSFALGPPAFIVAALTSDPLVAALALTGVGAAVGAINVVTVTMRQSLVPPRMRGRVNASYRLVAFGLTTVGAALGGLLSEVWGLRAPFIAGAVILAVGLLASPRGADDGGDGRSG
jgi:MFS family permease